MKRYLLAAVLLFSCPPARGVNTSAPGPGAKGAQWAPVTARLGADLSGHVAALTSPGAALETGLPDAKVIVRALAARVTSPKAKADEAYAGLALMKVLSAPEQAAALARFLSQAQAPGSAASAEFSAMAAALKADAAGRAELAAELGRAVETLERKGLDPAGALAKLEEYFAAAAAQPALDAASLDTLFDGTGRAAALDAAPAVEAGESAASSSGLSPAAERESGRAAPVPAPKLSADGDKVPRSAGWRRVLSFPKAAWAFLAAFVVTQFGIEALGVAIPQLAGSISYAAAAAVATFSTLGLAAGGLLGGSFVGRLGHWNAYAATLGGRAAAIGLLGALAYFGAVGPLALVALFTLDYFFLGASRTVEAVIPKRVLGAEVLRLSRFATVKNFLTDGIGMVGPILVGLAYQAFGSGSSFYWGVFAAYAAAFAASGLGVLVGLRRAASGAASTAAPAVPKAGETRGTFGEAWRAIRGNPVLRYGTLAYSVLYAFNIGIYFLVGPVFGYFAGGGDLAAAGQITSLLAGLNAAGGIFSYYWMSRKVARIEAATEPLAAGERERARRAAITRLTGRLTLAGAVALLTFWTFFLTTPLATIGVFGLAVPIFAAQLIMLPMGFFQSASINGLESLIQAELPDRLDERGQSLVKFQSYAANAVISVIFGAVLSALSVGVVPTSAAILALNVGISAVAAAIAFVGWRLLRRPS